MLIRDIVLHHRGEIAPRAEALLYAADRAHHIETVVRPALAAATSSSRTATSTRRSPTRARDGSRSRRGARPVALGDRRAAARPHRAARSRSRGRAERLDADDKPFDRLESEQDRVPRHACATEFLALAAAEPGAVPGAGRVAARRPSSRPTSGRVSVAPARPGARAPSAARIRLADGECGDRGRSRGGCGRRPVGRGVGAGRRRRGASGGGIRPRRP